MDFKIYFEQSENCDGEVRKTLKKIPKKHKNLIKGYKIVFQSGPTLKGDGGHIGFIDEEKKRITIAAPWNYGREYTLLHEIAHAVWKYLVDEKRREEWKSIVKNTKEKQKQNAEELFCMAYANEYANHEHVIHTHEAWSKFIKRLPK